MSSADEPITEPPPPGEEDAYSAATKVGVMPDELLAKLRAEGLLPPEEDRPKPPRPAPPRPSSSLRTREPAASPSTPHAEPPPAASLATEPPVGTPSAASNEDAVEIAIEPAAASRPPQAAPSAAPTPRSANAPFASSAEAPVPVGVAPGAPPQLGDAVDPEADARLFRSPRRRAALVVAAVAALAFAVAVLSLAR